MGVIWGAGMEEDDRLAPGVGICSSLRYFLRSLGGRLRALMRP